jgi:RNA polymerase sigma-70 factor (ECF subfamily)
MSEPPTEPFVNPAFIKHASEQPTLAQLKRLGDDELMVSLQAGNHDALAVLFDRYHRLVFSIALKIVRDKGEAEDVLQDVFLDIFRAVAQFDPARGSTRVWILQYAYHRALNRKQHLNTRHFYSQEGDEDLENSLSQGGLGFGNFTPGELKRLLKEGLATLSLVQRRVIELASFEGLSMKEIADKTEESLVNVRHHYYRGLRKLRSFVERPAEKRNAVGDE